MLDLVLVKGKAIELLDVMLEEISPQTLVTVKVSLLQLGNDSNVIGMYLFFEICINLASFLAKQ